MEKRGLSPIKKEKIEDKKPLGGVDREATCPLLLRVFCSNYNHNRLEEYSRGATPQNEIQIYTWLDASLKELTGLVKEVNPDARRRGTYFEFARIFPDLKQSSSKYISRNIGSTVSGTKGRDDEKTLSDARFVIGDYLDISITPPSGRLDRMDTGPRRGFGGGGGGGVDRYRGRPGDRDRDDDRGRDRNGRGFGGGRERNGGRGPAGGYRDRSPRDRSP